MKRALPLVAVVAVLAGGATLRPGAESGACAQGSAVVPRADCASTTGAGTGTAPASATPVACAAAVEGFASVRALPTRRGVRLAFTRRVARPARIDVFQSSAGRRVLGERLVARFDRRTTGVTWSGRAQRGRPRVRDGVLFARFTLRDERGRLDERRIALVRTKGRFRLRRAFDRRAACATLRVFKLERPVFGGARSRALGIAFQLATRGTVTVEVRRAGRVVRRFGPTARRAGVTHRLRLPAERLRRGAYEIRLVHSSDNGSLRASLYAERL